MPDTIFFQGYSGPQGGVSGCDVYTYGWTSGCVDPNTGLNRGFTQEWYYEESIGAWIAIGPDGASGGVDLDNVGPSYDIITNTSPEYEARVSGNLRKFAFLTEDGGLSFDYVFLPDLVHPADVGACERTFLQYLSPNLTQFDSRGGEVPYPVSGTTLCSDGTYNYIYSTNSTTEALILSFNTDGTANGTSYSPLTVGPSGDGIISVNTDNFGINPENILLPSDVGSSLPSLPKGVSLSNGRNVFRLQDFFFGFTFNGPHNDVAGLDFSYWLPSEGSISARLVENLPIKLENYWYAFASTEPDARNITSADIVSGSKGASGTFGILNATSNNQNHNIGPYTLPPSDFGNAGSESFIYLAFPTRSNIDPSQDLFFNPTTSAAGFSRGSADQYQTINVTNDLNYTEEYELFRAQQTGVNTQGLKIDTQ